MRLALQGSLLHLHIFLRLPGVQGPRIYALNLSGKRKYGEAVEQLPELEEVATHKTVLCGVSWLPLALARATCLCEEAQRLHRDAFTSRCDAFANRD